MVRFWSSTNETQKFCPRRWESARGLAQSKTLRARGSRNIRAGVLI
jgi:hypothetical protein